MDVGEHHIANMRVHYTANVYYIANVREHYTAYVHYIANTRVHYTANVHVNYIALKTHRSV